MTPRHQSAAITPIAALVFPHRTPTERLSLWYRTHRTAPNTERLAVKTPPHPPNAEHRTHRHSCYSSLGCSTLYPYCLILIAVSDKQFSVKGDSMDIETERAHGRKLYRAGKPVEDCRNRAHGKKSFCLPAASASLTCRQSTAKRSSVTILQTWQATNNPWRWPPTERGT